MHRDIVHRFRRMVEGIQAPLTVLAQPRPLAVAVELVRARIAVAVELVRARIVVVAALVLVRKLEARPLVAEPRSDSVLGLLVVEALWEVRRAVVLPARLAVALVGVQIALEGLQVE